MKIVNVRSADAAFVPPSYLVGVCLVIIGIWVMVLRGFAETFVLSPVEVRQDSGHAYIARLPSRLYGMFVLRGDTGDAPVRSDLQLFENGQPLGPGHALHQDVRERGAGRFSHWVDHVYFSATDNTDPSSNGRAYEAVGYVRLQIFAGFVISIVLLLPLLQTRSARWQGESPVPSLQPVGLNIAVPGAFLLAIAAQLPGLLTQAATADARLNHAIPLTAGDDGNYQVLAINLRHGLGYSSRILLPIDRYRLDERGPGSAEALPSVQSGAVIEFRRSPGLSLMLAGVYLVFGSETIVTQRTMALLAWLTGVLLLITGAVMAGWAGSLAGGLSALYHLNYFPGTYHFERILTENPTAFCVALCGLLFTLYLKRGSTLLLVASALSLAGVILMRLNFLPVLPLLALYLAGLKRRWGSSLLFAAVAALPLLLWSGYASLAVGRPVLLTQGGPRLFAHTNNLDTLEGVGPDRWNQGGWNPGFYRKADGTWASDNHNVVQPGENGWRKGLTFWWNNLSRLPELFFVKLRTGFWFSDGGSLNWLRPEGFFLIGIGYLLVAVGFLPFRLPLAAVLRQPPERLLVVQIALIAVLFVLWNKHGLLPVLAVWSLLMCLSLLRLSGRQQPLAVPNPAWFLGFVISHAMTTLLFYGVRFHLPLDSSLMLICFLGVTLTVRETARHGWLLPVCFAGLIVVTVFGPIY